MNIKKGSIIFVRILGTYGFLVPLLGEVEVVSVDDEEDVDDYEQVVRVPKGVEAGEPLQGFWEVKPVAAEPRGGQRESYGHEEDHDHAGPTFRALHEPPVVSGPFVPEKRLHGLVFFVRRV